MIKFVCDNCEGVIAVEKETPGTTVGCGHCKHEITVPEPFTKGFVIQDFKVLEKLNENSYKCHQISLDLPVSLKIQKLSDNESNIAFIQEGRKKAKKLKVHSMGQEGDYLFQASVI